VIPDFTIFDQMLFRSDDSFPRDEEMIRYGFGPFKSPAPDKAQALPGAFLFAHEQAEAACEGKSSKFFGKTGAGSRIRTRDPEITNHVLYQLSYTGAEEGF
jgi:hypothetical protein